MASPQLVLTAVLQQVATIHQELAVQMKRMAQIQAQLDDVRHRVEGVQDAVGVELAEG